MEVGWWYLRVEGSIFERECVTSSVGRAVKGIVFPPCQLTVQIPASLRLTLAHQPFHNLPHLAFDAPTSEYLHHLPKTTHSPSHPTSQ